jgi:hypothetical protein
VIRFSPQDLPTDLFFCYDQRSSTGPFEGRAVRQPFGSWVRQALKPVAHPHAPNPKESAMYEVVLINRQGEEILLRTDDRRLAFLQKEKHARSLALAYVEVREVR